MYFSDTIRKVDLATANWTSAYMCTDFCPCPSDKIQNYTYKYSNETRLNLFNRTKKTGNTNTALKPFVTTDVLADAYFSFSECYDDILDYQDTTNSQQNVLNSTVYDMGPSLINFLDYLETSFACNGICQPGIFFFFKNVTDGPPTSNCIAGLQDVFQENSSNVGAALMISFFFTILAFSIQYNFWNFKRCNCRDKRIVS